MKSPTAIAVLMAFLCFVAETRLSKAVTTGYCKPVQ